MSHTMYKVINSVHTSSDSPTFSLNNAVVSAWQAFANRLAEVGISDDLAAILRDVCTIFSNFTTKEKMNGSTLADFVKVFKDVVVVLVDLADAVTDTLITLLIQLLDLTTEAFDTKIDIPIISVIFGDVVGIDLTCVFLVACVL